MGFECHLFCYFILLRFRVILSYLDYGLRYHLINLHAHLVCFTNLLMLNFILFCCMFTGHFLHSSVESWVFLNTWTMDSTEKLKKTYVGLRKIKIE